MSCLSAVEAQLPPGFRFHPKDEELICDYLTKWITGSPQQSPFLIEVDLNKCEPWDIPEAACVGRKEWYCYSQRDRKYATGLRTNRATVSGYWKATGKDRPAIKNGILVGMRKTLVFYQGRAPNGRKTEWIMHEFRLEGNMEPEMKTFAKEDWVLCRVFYKNRSEAITCKQEKACIYTENSSPSSLPPLMEPHITFNNPAHDLPRLDDLYQEQVPCFSIFPQNQTAPNNNNFPQILPSTRIMPTNFGETLPEPEIYTSQLSYNNNNCDDQKVLKALLNHITKIGSSDSYPSEVGGLSSMWNQYS